jgi:hypothetical protein
VAFFRSRIAAIGAGLYVLVFLCAAAYPMFDRRTFSGLFAVMLAWPWIDYLPSWALLLGVALNTAAIYVVLALPSFLLRRSRK